MRDHKTIDEIIKLMISFSYDENEYSSLNSEQLKQDPRFIDPDVYLGYNACLTSWFAHVNYGKTYKVKLRTLKFYKRLYELFHTENKESRGN